MKGAYQTIKITKESMFANFHTGSVRGPVLDSKLIKLKSAGAVKPVIVKTKPVIIKFPISHRVKHFSPPNKHLVWAEKS